ncbi:MAG TPA: PQQ-binding-like beta-propeller repeat protein [Alphaproteobacteria bacterium]|nr:PQQ-binding-like beta-propeller repeat protein [Alphaproteobacteria bacterium]
MIEPNMSFLTRHALLAAALSVAGCDTFLGSPEGAALEGERIAVLHRADGVEADPALAGVPFQLPDPVLIENWPQAGGSPSHALGHVSLDAPLSRAWSVDLGAGESDGRQILSGPVVAEGRVFAMDAEASVSAFDLDSGQRIWRVDLEPEDEDESYFGGGVAFDDGRLFVTTGFARLYALDASTGETVWEARAPAPMRAAPTAADGRIFAVTLDNQLLAVSAEDGRQLWTHSGLTEATGIVGGASPAVSGPIVIAPYSSGELFAIRVENGRVLWSEGLSPVDRFSAISTLSDIVGRPVIDGDLVIATSHAGLSVAIELRRGGPAWELSAGGPADPWVAGDTVFLIGGDARLLAVTRSEGRVRWIQQLARYEDEEDRTGPIGWAGPVLAGNLLYVVSSHGQMLALSAADGSITASYDLPSGSRIAPVVAEGTLLVVTRSGQLVAYR